MVDRMSDRFEPPGDVGLGKSYGPIPIDVLESDAEFVVNADVPGCTKEHVEVRLLDDETLQIAVDYHHATDVGGEGYVRQERRRRHVNRTIELPGSVDDGRVTANCENGVLTVRLPRTTEGQSGRRIEITG